MTIRGLALDLEGTVIDVEAAHHQGHLAAAKEFGLTMSLEEAYTNIGHFIGGPDEKVCEDIRSCLDESTREEVTVEQILARDKFHYERLLREMPIIPRPGFWDFFEKATSLGLRISIGSLTPVDQAMTLLERSGLSLHIPRRDIVLREDVVNVKPAPDVFLKTAEIMGVEPSGQVVFEDSPRGVQAAIAAGTTKVVGMPVVIRGATVGALVDAGVCRIFFHWGEINISALVRNLSNDQYW